MTNFPRDHSKLTLALIVLVAGSAIFGAKDYAKAIAEIRARVAAAAATP